MRENVTISYRGAHYELGRGQNFYGIWPAAGPEAGPIEWWPETPEGWRGAWSRFTAVEAPGTIHPPAPPAPAPDAREDTGLAAIGLQGSIPPRVTTPPVATTPPPATPPVATAPPQAAPPPLGTAPAGYAPARPPAPAAIAPVLRAMGAIEPDPAAPAPASPRSRAVLAAALLALGVACGIAGLFPGYFTSQGFVHHQPEQLVPHLIYLAGWAVGAGAVLLGGARQRAGALLAAGLSIVTFGLLFSDTGQVVAGNAPIRAGLVLTLVGWLLCAAGSVLAVLLRPAGPPAGPLSRMKDPALAVTVALLAALGAAAAFVPAWDAFTLRDSSGVLESVTDGYAFSEPGLMITGTVLVMVGLVLAVLLASLWRPVRLGAALLAGATLPMVAQGISAMIEIRESVPATSFGIPSSQATQLGISVSAHLTWAFWLYAAFVVALAAICVWMLLPVHQAAVPGPPVPAPAAPPAEAPPATPADSAAAGTTS